MEQLTQPPPSGSEPVDPVARRQRVGFELVGEIVLVLGLWLGYRQVRHLTRDQAGEAFSNARQVIGFERALDLFNERAVQRFVLHSDAFVWFLNQYYARVHLP
ncbi:MAG: inositol phosphorylceramide synthase, partial [Ilumatobacter sp.]